MLHLSTSVGLRHGSAPADQSPAPSAQAIPRVANPNTPESRRPPAMLAPPPSSPQATHASALLALRADPERMLRRARDVEESKPNAAEHKTEVDEVSAADSGHEDGGQGSFYLAEQEEEPEPEPSPAHVQTNCRRRRKRTKPAL